jgi:hypothetical protein
VPLTHALFQRRVAVDGEMLSQGMGGAAFTQSSQGIARAGLFVDVSCPLMLLLLLLLLRAHVS